MSRSNKPLGDLEYEKFGEDSDGNLYVKTTEQSPFDYLKYHEYQLEVLNEILAELRSQSNYLRNLFAGDPL